VDSEKGSSVKSDSWVEIHLPSWETTVRVEGHDRERDGDLRCKFDFNFGDYYACLMISKMGPDGSDQHLASVDLHIDQLKMIAEIASRVGLGMGGSDE
jgi:hypothetical protein